MSRSNRSARQAGQKFERLIADYLRDELDDRIDIRPKNGRNDRGDIGGVRTTFAGRVVLECKDSGGELRAGEWYREAEVEAANDDAVAGFVVAKRRLKGKPGDQWVIGTVDDLLALLSDRRPREW